MLIAGRVEVTGRYVVGEAAAARRLLRLTLGVMERLQRGCLLKVNLKLVKICLGGKSYQNFRLLATKVFVPYSSVFIAVDSTRRK